MFNSLLNSVRLRPELIILLLMVMIIAMFIIPLPTYLVDFLLALNMVLAILVLMGSFYIDRILSFSTFPAVLLITTLFRLALSISTSRLILIEADAGEIIATFGQFVIGESLAVGFVVFSIVTIVQFIVITKGSERVAEVAARFSLDGMPGKQMSIDADLKAGIIDADAARERRSVLERESQLYGSFDGAMKFIKGDAIAGIIIIFVNFIGGISVGMTRHNMDFSGALSTYTMLTIGDGLVAQIPALLIAISAGFIVTRVNGDSDNMGRNIMGQLLGNPFVLAVTAVLTIAMGTLPGFPFPVFIILSTVLGILFYFKWRSSKSSDSLKGSDKPISRFGDAKGDVSATNASAQDNSSLGLITNLDKVSTETVPLILLVPKNRCAALEKSQFIERLQSQFFIDYGVRLPDMLLRDSNQESMDNTVSLLINEIRVDQFELYFDLVRIINYSDEVNSLGIDLTYSHYGASTCVWVNPSHSEMLEKLGYQLRSATDELYHCISVLLVRNVHEYFGIQETKHMLDQLEDKYPDLLKEVLRHATVQRISEVFQRLLNERISIRNMKLIMEALALWAPREKDVINLVEHVRGMMARYICHKFAYGSELRVVMISSEVEDIIRKGIRQTSGSAFLNLEPETMDSLMDLFSLGLNELPIAHKDIVLLTSVDVRRFIKKLVENRFPDLEVVSFGEITDSKSVNVIKTI
ncbi:EscV/YscV/HrcV family type III secretion system export apparatus protein [Providencia alcalifaciens]|uniref:Type III secretion system protein BsaQ n=2 Tax=Enterobacterales TaxID=91347 RepID=A0AAV3M8G8_9GAMM|nr:EscV/YscV/HrcV family type III secretion system export apparatus protein [Providencia alcalifaciens]EUD04096.1 type III secretion system protein BsaQ [Providencia alcalifaciens RIMD 1656011]EUD11669.1 type III secretion system protein BsaQ [Providencia alcalifaciens 205/92]MTC25705.1 EscV/YscV/HrcV family type III secretion system export apparatus protein [Providencia alcalifaciens]MTC62781.1 EscV/YscV/HrcV family type III secretion system export apparatus protein [Providencia alcalifaciens]